MKIKIDVSANGRSVPVIVDGDATDETLLTIVKNAIVALKNDLEKRSK